MIRIANPTPATATLLDSIADTLDAATWLPGRRAKAALTELARDVADRNIANLAGTVNPDEVQLTDEQWAQIAKEIRKAGGGGPSSQW